MKTHAIPTALALILVAALPAQAQTSSTYLPNPNLADYSGISPSGGSITVPYELLFGTPPPSLGSTFDVTITVSAITSYTGTSYSWASTPPNSALGIVGLLYPSNVFDDLPPLNQNALPTEVNGVTLDPGINTRLWMQENFTAGNFDFLGEFTVTLSALPSTPGYEAFTQFNIWSEAHSFLLDGSIVRAGFWATMGPPMEPSNEDNATRATSFSTSLTYQFTAFSDGALLPIDDDDTVWTYSGFTQFDVIPEPHSLALLAAAGSLLIFRRRRA